MENDVFTYRYSAKRNEEIEKIRKRYLPEEESKLDKLKRLDGCVQSAGIIESLIVGIVGVLTFGIGMCFGLDVFAGADWLTIAFCLLGAVIMLPAYPIYKKISEKTKKRLAPEILSISEELLGAAQNGRS